MIWIIVLAATVIIAIAAFAMVSRRKKHWQVGYKTLRPDMLPKREKNAQSQTSGRDTPIWGNYSEPKKEEQQNSWASWGSQKTEKKEETSDDTPIIPPGMFD